MVLSAWATVLAHRADQILLLWNGTPRASGSLDSHSLLSLMTVLLLIHCPPIDSVVLRAIDWDEVPWDGLEMVIRRVHSKRPAASLCIAA